jgi:hypothetical protein
MKLSIARQDSYAKGDLIIKFLFGAFYIGIPHFFAMLIPAIIAQIYMALLFWVLLFTGKFPKSWHEHLVKLTKWNVRLTASLYFMIEGSPEIGMNKESSKVTLELPYTEDVARGTTIVRFLFGGLICLPQMILLYIRMALQSLINMLAFLSLLFKGEYPANLFTFSEGTMRLQLALMAYLSCMTDTKPKLSGNQD